QPPLLRSVLPAVTATEPSTISHVAATTANAKEKVTEGTVMSSWPNSTASRSTDSSTLSSNVMVASKDRRSSATNFNRIPVALATFTTGDFSGETKTAAATSSSTVTPSNSTVTYSTPSAALLPSDQASTNPTTLFPTGLALTSPMVTQDSPTPDSNSTQQATELNHDFINLSTTSPHSKDAREDKTNKGGVIGGVIVGFVLLSILILLIGYFTCGKKRSESFSHRRLYDDTRNDPVLHLDKSLGPYDTSFGYASDVKTSRGDKAEEDNMRCPSPSIPMDDMTTSHPSL
ncbi:MUC15 protein, partial [Psilopogon haemacephalus]|nr:MUC15 protein [Psilopogon haemacephalus]